MRAARACCRAPRASGSCSPLLERSQRLLEGGRVVAPDRHRLTHRLHRRGEPGVGGGELLEREPRHLHDHIVERGLEGCGGHLRDVVRDLVEPVSDRELRGDLRDQEPGGLRRERARARNSRVHLDDDDPAGLRMHRELDVAAPRVDTHRADDVDADVAQPLVLPVGEGERRSDRDRVTGVDADAGRRSRSSKRPPCCPRCRA